MIHETLPGGLAGALVIFGGMYVGIIAAGVVGCVVLAKAIEKLQSKPSAPAEEASS